MVETEALHRTGLFQRRYDGAQDHALLLRLAEAVGEGDIVHVPEVLYHWRKSAGSMAESAQAKDYAISAGINAITDHITRLGVDAEVSNIFDSAWYRVSWKFRREPRVTVIIPFRDVAGVTRECLDRVLSCTEYKNYDVILVDNWSTSHEAEALCEEMGKVPRVRVIRVDQAFNFSKLNNLAVAQTDAEFVVMMNNDLLVREKIWLRTLVNEALADDRVAVVGGKYVYPNGRVQHGGVVLGVGGVASHAHVGLAEDDPGYAGRALFAQEMSAVTAACMLVRTSSYRRVGGLDEVSLQVAFNDVDFCLKVRRAGLRVIWTPAFIAEHQESLSRGVDQEPHQEGRFFDEHQAMGDRWGPVLASDPFYSRFFLLPDGREFFDLAPPTEPPKAGEEIAAQRPVAE